MEARRTQPLHTWPLGKDEKSTQTRLSKLAEVFQDKKINELKDAINFGLDVNEWYNTQPDWVKSMGTHRMYSHTKPRMMLAVHEEDRVQLIHLAATCRWVEGVEVLLKAGANVNAYDFRHSQNNRDRDASFTPLMHACCYASVPLLNVLLKNGADAKAKDPFSRSSPVSMAIKFFSFPILKLLLDHGAEITAQNANEMSLHEAVNIFINPLVKVGNTHQLSPEELQGKTEDVRSMALHIMEILLQNGADPNTPHPDSLPPLHLSAEGSRGELRSLELLTSFGADVNLLTKGAFFHAFSHLTPLLAAVIADDNLTAVHWLIQHGANVDEKVCRYYRGRVVGEPISILTIALDEWRVREAAALMKAGCEITTQNVDAMNGILTEMRATEAMTLAETGQRIPELVESIEAVEDLLQFVKEPQNLKWQIRKALRIRFGVHQKETVNALPLPRPIKEFVMCYDL